MRTKLAAAIKAGTGLECHNTVPDVIQPPCALLIPFSGDWDNNVVRSMPRNKYELTIVLPASLSLEEAQDTLDGYLDAGAGGIKTAVEGTAFSGEANYARVVGWHDYAQPVLDNYIGVKFDIMVY